MWWLGAAVRGANGPHSPPAEVEGLVFICSSPNELGLASTTEVVSNGEGESFEWFRIFGLNRKVCALSPFSTCFFLYFTLAEPIARIGSDIDESTGKIHNQTFGARG